MIWDKGFYINVGFFVATTVKLVFLNAQCSIRCTF
jgi:hypothetical protein